MDVLSIGFFPRAHTAIAQWLACMVYIVPYAKRYGKASVKQIALYIGFLGVLLAVNMLNEDTSDVVWILLVATSMFAMLGMILSTSEIKLTDACYVWAHTFIAAEFAASLEWQISYLLIAGGNLNMLGSWGVMALVYVLVFGALWKLNNARFSHRAISVKETVSAVAITLGTFFLSNTGFVFKNTLFAEVMGTGLLYFRTLMDFGGLALIFAHDEARSEIALRLELESMEGLLNRQYEQYRQFEANNKTLHRVYHDLKHQIAFIRNEPSEQKRDSYLEELDRAVSMREAEVNTGNAVLDTFLTSKSLMCMQHGIVMTCFADAHDLDFMDVMDVCSLFGNAIDNAVECVQQIEEKDKRLIKVSVYTQNRFILIRIENYCETEVDLSGGLPATTKENKEFHGYGIKSIKRAAEKYNGCVTLEQQDEWFTISALIPLPDGHP